MNSHGDQLGNIQDADNGDLTDTSDTDELMDKLIEKCKLYQIDAVKKKWDFDDVEFLEIFLNSGRSKRRITFVQRAELILAINSSFQDFVFLENYEAIVNYKEKTIEAAFGQVGHVRSGFINSVACKVLFGSDEINPTSSILKLVNNNGSSIELSSLSSEARVLCLEGRRDRRAVSIKIKLQALNGHDHALAELHKVANSLFFQIDNQSRILFQLSRARRGRRQKFRNRLRAESIDLQFPRMEYDSGPISLFWYARSAEGMPLLQFLAFYQVIEYYYSTFFQLEARNMIRALHDGRVLG